MLRDFSLELGWRPAYYLTEAPFVADPVSAHLIVEHGLEPSAVITFVSQRHRLSDLNAGDLSRLMEISYNNLADWQLYVEADKVTFCYNRAEKPVVDTQVISRTDHTGLGSDAFDEIVGRRPNPNYPALDEALIRTISDWKRILSAELDHIVSNESLSALFNAILFARAVEDYHRRSGEPEQDVLLDRWNRSSSRSLGAVLRMALTDLVSGRPPPWIVDQQKLAPFADLDPQTVSGLLADFYHNRFAPYRYDFSVMSKHALSRIYEHYSSLLHVEHTEQASFFPILPEEERNKYYGSVYTPEYIARFFARFLQDQMSPRSFRTIHSVDPASGSGIFLRTLLELQCDPVQDGVTSQTIDGAFRNIFALDVDENATQATRLSLALLHLVLTGRLPPKLNVVTAETFSHFAAHPELASSFDAVLVNPPFIALGTQTADLRQTVRAFMGEEAEGRIDTYMAFLRLGLELLRPGGYGLYVLPHSFLVANQAQKLRKRLAADTYVRFLADLSAIRVFGNLGSYIILLIFQKKPTYPTPVPAADIVRCQDLVGHALEDYLQGEQTETSFYSIYQVEQSQFTRGDWIVLPPAEADLRRRLDILPKLGDLCNVRQGLVSGADDVFITDAREVPQGEEAVYRKFLPDRLMERFHVPDTTEKVIFYPFVNDHRLSQHEISRSYPRTWKGLESKRSRLEGRGQVRKGHVQWWEPERPRRPEHIFRPKIVTPHLVVLPRFSLDVAGEYAVSRSPMITMSESGAEDDMLRYLVAVLNSPVCYWYLSRHSHKYSRGYSMLEVKTLRGVPVPDLGSVSPTDVTRLLGLVNRRLESAADIEAEREIEEIVAKLYGLSPKERAALGIGA